MNKNICQFLYLVGCALHQCKPNENDLGNLDYKKIYLLSKQHSLTSLLANTIQQSPASKEIKKIFMDAFHATLRKSLLFDAERERILARMEEEGIYYLPLKGIIVNHLYPMYGMREFADNDILYDKSKQKELTGIFKEMGYKIDSLNVGNHDVFIKKPCFNFEMHRQLVSGGKEGEYYKSIMDRAIKEQGKQFSYHLPISELYAYLMVHAHKHASCSGNGLRYLVDQYFFLEKYEEKIDFAWVSSLLSSFGFAEFERTSYSLCKKLFLEPKMIEDDFLQTNEEEALFSCFASGTYGNKDVRTYNTFLRFIEKNGEKSKVKFVFSRLFPPLSWYKQNYPFLYNFKIFIPFFLVYRFIKRGLFGKRIVSEISIINHLTKQKEG